MRGRLARIGLGLAAWLVVLLAIAGGTGVLYLLRGGRLLEAGPGVGHVLGLQQLAGTPRSRWPAWCSPSPERGSPRGSRSRC